MFGRLEFEDAAHEKLAQECHDLWGARIAADVEQADETLVTAEDVANLIGITRGSIGRHMKSWPTQDEGTGKGRSTKKWKWCNLVEVIREQFAELDAIGRIPSLFPRAKKTP